MGLTSRTVVSVGRIRSVGILETVLRGRLLLSLLLTRRLGHILAKQSRRRGQGGRESEDGEAFYKLCAENDPHPFLCVSVKGINTRNGINCEIEGMIAKLDML